MHVLTQHGAKFRTFIVGQYLMPDQSVPKFQRDFFEGRNCLPENREAASRPNMKKIIFP